MNHVNSKYLWYFDLFKRAIVSHYLDPIIIIGMVPGFQVATPILPRKMPANDKQRNDTHDMAHPDNSPRDVIPYERCIRLKQSHQEV